MTSSTFFEPNVFILRNTAVKAIFVWYVYMHGRKNASRWKRVAIVCDIEHNRNTYRTQSQHISNTIATHIEHNRNTYRTLSQHISNSIAKHIEHYRNTYRTQSQHISNTIAKHIEHNRNTYRTQSQHISNTIATHIEHHRNTYRTPSQHISNTIATHIEHYRNTLPAARRFAPMHVNTPHKNCVYNWLPEDEPMRFETSRRCQKCKSWIKALVWNVCISLV